MNQYRLYKGNIEVKPPSLTPQSPKGEDPRAFPLCTAVAGFRQKKAGDGQIMLTNRQLIYEF